MLTFTLEILLALALILGAAKHNQKPHPTTPATSMSDPGDGSCCDDPPPPPCPGSPGCN